MYSQHRCRTVIAFCQILCDQPSQAIIAPQRIPVANDQQLTTGPFSVVRISFVWLHLVLRSQGPAVERGAAFGRSRASNNSNKDQNSESRLQLDSACLPGDADP